MLTNRWRLPALMLLLLWATLVTVLRVRRWPNDYAEAHWLLDYRYGFVKRALPGELLHDVTSWFGVPVSEAILQGLSAGLLGLFLLMLLAMALRIVRHSRFDVAAVVVVVAFLVSPFVVMSTHMIGSFDNLIVMLTVAAIMLLMRGFTWLAGLLMSVAVLVHENVLLLGYPLLVVAWLIRREGEGDEKASWLPLVLPVLAAMLVFLSRDIWPTPGFSAGFAAQLMAAPFIRAGFVPGCVSMLDTPFLDYLQHEWPRFAGRLGDSALMALVLPGTLALWALVVLAARPRLAVAIAGLVACLAPQLLHAVAWDTARIWTFTLVDAFILLWLCAAGSAWRASPGWLAPAALAVVVWYTRCWTPLLDYEVAKLSFAIIGWLYFPVLGVLALAIVHTTVRKTRVARVIFAGSRSSRPPVPPADTGSP